MTPAEFRKQRAAKLGQARGIYDKIKSENRDPTPEETAQVNTLINEADAFETKAVGAEQWAMVDQRMASLNQSTGRVTDPLPHEDPLNTRNGLQKYSMLKAFREAATCLTGLEKEVNDELVKRRYAMGRGKPNGNVMVPNNLPVNTREARQFAFGSGIRQVGMERYDLDTTSGGGSIPTILDANMIDILLRQDGHRWPRRERVGRYAGALRDPPADDGRRLLLGQPGHPRHAQQPGRRSGAFLAPYRRRPDPVHAAILGADQSEGRGVHPLRSGGRHRPRLRDRSIQWPRLRGRPPGHHAESADHHDLGRRQWRRPTWTNVVQLESTVAEANADMGSLAYVTDAAMRGTLKTTLKIGTTFPVYIWETGTDRPVNDYPCGVTNLLPNNLIHGSGTSLHALLYANWNDLYYAFWSGMDVVVDPFTNAGAGSVIVTTLQDGDINERHPESFAKLPDLISTQ